ncbi:M16 family peptidase [Chryseobacterium sp. StRB126]|uniref:hypothetical protein n=1 Tax=Chryseobacterium sp. StRB126 TaxID=878220 RepID=UPI0004E98CB1|nr:hypothetical protein [Chryseobacterium sp. StRB126]BAP32208.1 M16 family peptidase [Chryseobacterium sp. StRB126]
MRNVTIILSLLMFSVFYSQNKCERLKETTESLLNMYVKDTLKTSFKDGDYIIAYIYSNEKFNTIGFLIDTFNKKNDLYKKSTNYRWFKFKNKKLIIFCDLNPTQKCKEYFNKLKSIELLDVDIEIKDQETIDDQLDGEIKPWSVYFNKDYKIINVSGKIIEAEIAAPKEFKMFLKKFSNLKLYQMTENGVIVYPKPHR